MQELISPEKERYTHSLVFRVSLWWRVAYGAIKVIIGTVLWWVAGGGLSRLFYALMSKELLEDPNDWFVHLVGPRLEHVSLGVTHFAAFYFIFWGITEAFLSVHILKKNLWAYPAAIALIAAFTLYEVFRVAHTKSLVLAAVIVLDACIVWILYREYQKLRGTADTSS